MTQNSRLFVVCGLLLCFASCSSGDENPERGSNASDRGVADSAVADVDAEPAVQDSVLISAAEDIVAFLRGAATYETLSLADSVELLIPEEGGGTRHRMSREALRDRQAWKVRTNGLQYSFVPAANFTEMKIAPNQHFNCFEGPLSERVPGFSESPHVGVRLEPSEMESCLQGWNATFVFYTTSGQLRLSAAIYDNWEW